MAFAYILGDTLYDRITTFRGVVTGRADYITGCNTYLLQPQGLKDGSPIESRWIDEDRLVYDAAVPRLTLPHPIDGLPGADKPAPKR